MATGSGAGRKVKPSGGFELLAWYWMRISGLLLVFLALGHLFITHIVYNVEAINYAFVASRWAAPKTGFIWRIWDLTMISLATFHGFNGLRQVLDEYVHKPGRRVLVHTLIWGSMLFLLAIGSYAILMFQRDDQYIKEWEKEHGRSAAVRAESSGVPALLAKTSR
jgi:succinate dehydrogenase / fumarate reductase membrane anchor subunit